MLHTLKFNLHSMKGCFRTRIKSLISMSKITLHLGSYPRKRHFQQYNIKSKVLKEVHIKKLIKMADKSNSITNKSTQFHLSHWSLMLFVIMLWMSSVSCMPQFTPQDLCGIDVYRKPLNCSYGSFTVNLDPRFCADTEVCYLGLGEPCKRNIMELRCARGLTCRCGRCMNCLGGDCNMEVWCQNKIEVPKRVATPYENVLRFYNRGENGYIN